MNKQAQTLQCNLCNQPIISNGMVSHIKHHHRSECSVEEYVERFGEFRQSKLKLPPTRNIDKTTCFLCRKSVSNVGMATHLRDSHNGMTPDEYIWAGGTEYRKEKISQNEMLRLSDGKYICKMCKFECRNEAHLTEHITRTHRITKRDYVRSYIFPDGVPKCLCGCGQEVKLLEQYPYRRVMIAGHGLGGELNPMYGRTHGYESTEKMRASAVLRTSRSEKTYDTKPELQFKQFLDENSIKYETQYPIPQGIVDYYLPEYDLLVEIDGEYWHPTEYTYLNAKLLLSACSQKQKEHIPNLIRIRSNDVSSITCIDDLHKYNFKYNSTIAYDQIVISKEFFKKTTVDKSKLIHQLWKFVRLFQPTFPTVTTSENISDVILKINKIQSKNILNDRTFRNNCSVVGVSYLKSIFSSYWESSFKSNMSPIAAWEDKKIMYRTIKYRIGLNDTEETFDFSLHQLVRGLSAQRITVSFFKPVLAAAIYEHFLPSTQSPVVFDPCCGFGGRLLGFKSKFPDGTYIGCEPNVQTYNELVELSKNFTNITLYNCKLEDFDLNLLPNIDLAFTSIPYYDIETYSNPTTYDSFEHWVGTFICKLKQIQNLVVNVPNELRNLFDENAIEYLISTNTSHFNKKTNQKFEFLLKL